METPLDELYFKWLYSQVADPEVVNPYATHWRLLKLLYTREFVWFVPNDDNRIADGTDLRIEFIDSTQLQDVDPSWIRLPCSVLELMIALSRKLSFNSGWAYPGCFWGLLDNIQLKQYNDRRNYSEDTIQDILDTLIFRTYKYDGRGGLFPLRDGREDQRRVELWYQMCAYILENT
jgi:hypothetical protein